jgi:hypothetical protein
LTVNTNITWPARPTCHGERSPYTQQEVIWRPPFDGNGGPYYYDWRTCSFCGSIHPEDLLRVLLAGAHMHGADWKYGWPHKFYLDDVPNKIAGEVRRTGGVYTHGNSVEDVSKQYPDANNWRHKEGDRWEGDLISPAPATAPAKWYNEHLLDLDEVAFGPVAQAILAHTGVEFKMIDGRLKFFAVRPSTL